MQEEIHSRCHDGWEHGVQSPKVGHLYNIHVVDQVLQCHWGQNREIGDMEPYGSPATEILDFLPRLVGDTRKF